MDSFYDYKIPNKKKWLLTKEFLITFKDELDKVFKVDRIVGKDKATYWSVYAHLTGTVGFYDALDATSKKHNVSKAIYEYALKLPWYDSDFFDDELVLMMVEHGIIQEGDSVEYGEI